MLQSFYYHTLLKHENTISNTWLICILQRFRPHHHLHLWLEFHTCWQTAGQASFWNNDIFQNISYVVGINTISEFQGGLSTLETLQEIVATSYVVMARVVANKAHWMLQWLQEIFFQSWYVIKELCEWTRECNGLRYRMWTSLLAGQIIPTAPTFSVTLIAWLCDWTELFTK